MRALRKPLSVSRRPDGENERDCRLFWEIGGSLIADEKRFKAGKNAVIEKVVKNIFSIRQRLSELRKCCV